MTALDAFLLYVFLFVLGALGGSAIYIIGWRRGCAACAHPYRRITDPREGK